MQSTEPGESVVRVMIAELTETITTALAQFSAASSLYALTVGDGSADLGSGGLLVEAFAADDAVQGIGGRDVIVVSTDAHIALAPSGEAPRKRGKSNILQQFVVAAIPHEGAYKQAPAQLVTYYALTKLAARATIQ